MNVTEPNITNVKTTRPLASRRIVSICLLAVLLALMIVLGPSSDDGSSHHVPTLSGPLQKPSEFVKVNVTAGPIIPAFESEISSNPAQQPTSSTLRSGSYRHYYDECYGQRYYSGSSSSNSADDGIRGMTTLGKGPEWSHDAWRAAHCGRIADGIAKLRSKSLGNDEGQATNQILFVDVKEECGRYREFLLTVRESGYAGMIVVLIYYAEDVGPCNEMLVAAFAPLEVFYHPSPRVEASMMQYYALKAFYSTDGGNAQGQARLRQYPIAATVRPEWVQWCKNPFPELIAKAGLGSTTNSSDSAKNLYLHLTHEGPIVKTVSDGFTIGSSRSLATLASLMVGHYPQMLGRGNAKSAAEDLLGSIYFYRSVRENNNVTERSHPPKPLPDASITSAERRLLRSATSDLGGAERGAVVLRPFASIDPSYTQAFRASFTGAGAECLSSFIDFCQTVPNSLVIVSRFQFCLQTNNDGGGAITGSSYCYLGYRNAIAEVPKAKLPDTIDALKHVTTATNFEAAMRIRKTAFETVYAGPSPAEAKAKLAGREWGGFSEECPDGNMAVMTMMGDYSIDRVRPFLESFTAFTNPQCTRLVIMLHRRFEEEQGTTPSAATVDPAVADRIRTRVKLSVLLDPLLTFASKFHTRIEMVYYVRTGGERDSAASCFGGSGTNQSFKSTTQTVFEPTAGRPRITVVLPHAQYRSAPYVDQRFEVGREWLERNYKAYRYVSNIDSRDIVFLGDPLRQLVKILRENGPVDDVKGTSYIDEDFVASVTESYTIGGSTPLNPDAAHHARRWLKPFGRPAAGAGDGGVGEYAAVHDYISGHSALIANSWGGEPYMGLRQSDNGSAVGWAQRSPTFTNGDPLAIVNSGHIIGTAVGLLHYYRLHVRMTVESKFKFDTSDQGTFTFYFYMVAAVTNYPHRLLGIHSSRSGFANPPHFNRVTRRAVELSPAKKVALASASRRRRAGRGEYGGTGASSGSADSSNRLSLAASSGEPIYEYSVKDCAGNTVAVAHQYDRDAPLQRVLEESSWVQYVLSTMGSG